MPLKQLDAPCWIIANADGTPAARWDERHFADEDEAADVLDCELEAERDGLAPRELPALCLTIVCDGCGKPYAGEPDSRLIDHFTDVADARNGAGEVEFRESGTTWCEDCRSNDGGLAKIYPSHSLEGEPCPCEQAGEPDPARETGRKRAEQLFAVAADENWLGI